MKLFNAIFSAATALISSSLIVANPAEARCTMFTPSPPASKLVNCDRAILVKQKSGMIHYRIYSDSVLFADVVLENNNTGSLRLLARDTFYHGNWTMNGNEVILLFENSMVFSFYV